MNCSHSSLYRVRTAKNRTITLTNKALKMKNYNKTNSAFPLNKKIINTACSTILLSTLVACGGGGSEGNDDNSSSQNQARSAQAVEANIPLTVMLRDGERIFDSVIDSYGAVNDFIGSRDILATLVNEQLAVYTGESANTIMISEPTFVNDLYRKMLELPSVQGVDENGNHIQLTPEILQQIKSGDVVITPVRSAEDVHALNFTEFSTERLSFYEKLVDDVEAVDVIGLTDFMKDDLGIDINDTDGTVFGVVETVLEFRDVLTGTDTLEEDLAAVQLRLDEMSTVLVSMNNKLDALSITMKEEFSDIQLGELDEKLLILKSKVALFNQASNNVERTRYATEVDFIYEELLTTLLNAIIEYDKRVKDTANYSNNADIDFDLRVNAKYDYLKFTMPQECDGFEPFENNLNSPVQFRQNGLIQGNDSGVSYQGHDCDWLTWYLLDYGNRGSHSQGTQWITNSYDTSSLVLDAAGKGFNNEINMPVPLPITSESLKIKDTDQYVLGYSKNLQVDFLSIFTSYIYARYLINPWVENIDSAESKNQAISESHLNMINAPVSQVDNNSLSLKENLLAIYSKMEQDHKFLFDGSLSENVTNGQQRAANYPVFFQGMIAQDYGTLNSDEIKVVSQSISAHLPTDSQISAHNSFSSSYKFDLPVIDYYTQVSSVANPITTYSNFDEMWTIRNNDYFTGEYLFMRPVKLKGQRTEVLCCVIEPGTPTFDAIDVYPSVRMRVGEDTWGAIDIGAVESGTASKLVQLYLSAKTDKLLKSVANLATLEIVLKTHCLGLNPTEERFEVCEVN